MQASPNSVQCSSTSLRINSALERACATPAQGLLPVAFSFRAARIDAAKRIVAFGLYFEMQSPRKVSRCGMRRAHLTGNGQNHFGIQAGATAQGCEYQCVKRIENTALRSLNKSTGDGQNQKRSGEPPKFWQLPWIGMSAVAVLSSRDPRPCDCPRSPSSSSSSSSWASSRRALRQRGPGP